MAFSRLLRGEQFRESGTADEEHQTYQDRHPARDRVGPHRAPGAATGNTGEPHISHDAGNQAGQALDHQPNGEDSQQGSC